MSDVRAKVHYDSDTGQYMMRHSQDVNPYLKQAAARRRMCADGEVDLNAESRTVAVFPDTVVMEIKRKHGIDLLNIKGDTELKKLLFIIDSEYPALRMTDRKLTTARHKVARVTR